MTRYEMRISTSDEAMFKDVLTAYKERRVMDFLGIAWMVQEVEGKFAEGDFTFHLVPKTQAPL